MATPLSPFMGGWLDSSEAGGQALGMLLFLCPRAQLPISFSAFICLWQSQPPPGEALLPTWLAPRPENEPIPPLCSSHRLGRQASPQARARTHAHARARTHAHARARSPPPPGHAGPGPPGFEQVLLERFLYLGQVSTSWGSGSSPVQQGDMRPTSWGCYKDHTLRIPPP